MVHANFNGLRVLALESRRAVEVEKLIRTYGGNPAVVPAMREIELESNSQVFQFADELLAGKFDAVIFMTGVGVRTMLDIVATKMDREEFLNALRKTKVIARGSKPSSVLRELKVPIAATCPEPSTWHELLTTIKSSLGDSLSTMRLALQEYGATNPELIAELSSHTRSLTKVPVYQWALPFDLGPLQECVSGLIAGNYDIVLFMTAVQVIHLFQVAEMMAVASELPRALRSIVVLSIGPTTTEELAHYGIQPDFEPSRPKMGFLINEAAQYAPSLLQRKLVAPDAADAQVIGPGASKSVLRIAPSTSTMAGFRDGLSQMEFVHEISSRIAAADPLHLVLDRIVDFIAGLIPCDSCFLYVIEAARAGEKLVLKASKNPHPDLIDQIDLEMGQGVIGWVAQHRQAVALASNASKDPRFKAFHNIPEDHFEAMLCTPILCAGRVIGAINLQHRSTYHHRPEEIQLLETLGHLVGAEIERARLESENRQLQSRLETRKLVDQAKSVLQRDLLLSEAEAYQKMQVESRQRRKSMRELAEAILLSDDLRKNRNEDSGRDHPGVYQA